MQSESPEASSTPPPTLPRHERHRLECLLRERLVRCGWRDDIRAHCLDILEKNKGTGSEIDKVVRDAIPIARARVPDNVKAELLKEIEGALKGQNKAEQ
mmetsp:Transcript_3670/g.13188  ORF Transcript_3670/g.13188 Transcript_3670/m.13188 type:complete len:99 (-) Transcript_3670:926-1222(-)